MQRFTIRYLNPYSQSWIFQSFSTIESAKRVIQLYSSCGTFAELVTQ
jgi:hypothetical protein